MEKEYLIELKKKIEKLSEEDKKSRDLYLKKIATGEIQGPITGYSSIDKPWLKYYDDKAISEDLPMCTIYDYIKKCNSDRMNYIALNYFGTKISYEKLFEKVDEVICSLKSMDIKKGDVVSLCLPTIPETFYMFLALNKIGTIANFIDPRINEERIEQYIKNSNSRLIVSIDNYNEKILNISKALGIKKIVCVSASQSLPIILKCLYKIKSKIVKSENFTAWNDFINSGKNYSSDIQEEYVANIPAAIEYTSGTTGIPKGAVLSNEGLNNLSFQQKSVLPCMIPGDTFLDIMPPFIAYGLGCGICAPLSAGLELILIPKFEPKDFDKLIMKHKPNHVLGVPSFFEDLCKSKRILKKDLSFIKYCIAGGDKMNVESERKINNFFVEHGIKHRIIKGYGMTELSSGAIIALDDYCNKLGSVGIPLVKNNIKVLSIDNNEFLCYNELGELYISSPTKMLGYYKKTEENQTVMVKDETGRVWIKTGDLGRIDNEGHVFIEGRIKRMIIRPDGHNVFPTAIEEVILSHNAVDNCAVVGLKSQDYSNGEIPTAFVVLKDQYKISENIIKKELTSLSLTKLPPRDVALSYIFVDSIPLTSVGKIDHKKLKEEYEKPAQKVKRI